MEKKKNTAAHPSGEAEKQGFGLALNFRICWSDSYERLLYAEQSAMKSLFCSKARHSYTFGGRAASPDAGYGSARLW
jgi:hypothetical protein